MSSTAKTTPADIYRQLKDLILSCVSYPGVRVTENELADRFHVSRTPVREALQRLAAESYVTILPKQGCFVRDIDIDEVNQYYEVRIGLELHVLDLVYLTMSDSQPNKLAAAWDPGQVPRRPPTVARDESFHMALAAGTGNVVLAGYLKNVNGHIHIVRRLDFTDATRIEQTYEEYHEVAQRLLARDVDSARPGSCWSAISARARR